MTVKLYELTDAYRKLADYEEETGRDLSDVLGEIQDSIEGKCANIAALVQAWTLEATAFTMEMQRLDARKKALDNRIRGLKDYLKGNLETAGLDKVKAGTFMVALQASPPSCTVLDLDALPAEYKRHVDYWEADRLAIIERWKATGEAVAGAVVSQGRHLRIR